MKISAFALAFCAFSGPVAQGLITVGTPNGVERRDMNGETVGQKREVGIAVPGGGSRTQRNGNNNNYSYNRNNDYNYRNNNNNYSYNDYNDYNNVGNSGARINRRFGFDGFRDRSREDRRYDEPGDYPSAVEKLFRRQNGDDRIRREREDFNYGMGNGGRLGAARRNTMRRDEMYDEDNRFYDAETERFGEYGNEPFRNNNYMQRPQRGWASGDRFENEYDRPRYEDDRYFEENDRNMNGRRVGRSQSASGSEWWENPNPAGPNGRMRGRAVGGLPPSEWRRNDREDYYDNNNDYYSYDQEDFYRGREGFRGGAMTPRDRPPMQRASGTTRISPVNGGSYHSYEDRTTTIHGGSLHTFPLDEAVDRVQVYLQAEAPWMPVEATVELWQGPDFVEELAEVYVPTDERPFSGVFDTRQNSAYDEWTIVIRNTGPVEHPILASVESYR